MEEIVNQNIEEFYKNLELPVTVEVSFEKIFDHIVWLSKNASPEKKMMANFVLELLKPKQILNQSFSDLSILETHAKDIELLMKPLFPEMLQDNEIKAGTLPFKPIFFNRTKRFQNILENAGKDFFPLPLNKDPNLMYQSACLFILNSLYGANINFSTIFYYEIPNINTGSLHYYRAFYNGDFLVPQKTERSPEISKADIQLLLDNYNDIDLWKKMIPPKSFIVKGFGLVTLLDVTTDMALSKLKDILVEEEDLEGNTQLQEIEKDINSILKSNTTEVGIILYDEEAMQFRQNGQNWKSFILSSFEQCSLGEALCDESKHILVEEKSLFIVPNLEGQQDSPSPLVKKLLNQGIKSFVAFPLISEGKIIGILEFASKKPNEFSLLTVESLKEIVPLFTIALQRSLNQYETKLEAIVQEQFTSLHQSVEWRFFEEAAKIYASNQREEEFKVDDIVFNNVYPLYGQSDIRSSTRQRNQGIQADMIEQLTLAQNVLAKAIKIKPLPILDQLDFEIKTCSNHLKDGINAGDEVKILEFLKKEVYPVFDNLAKEDDLLAKLVDEYKDALNPKLGVVYKKRKDYEDSVMKLNKIMSKQLEKAQKSAQAMYPHYIESYKTDGLEHNIYIGQSLVKHKVFNEMYLQNLRLWQLITICEIENLVHRKRDTLPVPLEVASLVLALSTPLSIKFRQDEKKFDVDGAYNVRYEIIKKRIDKAKIRGKNERITQPGKLVVVYSQAKEASEYIKYFNYLASLNYIEEEVEIVDLEVLQETAGLKAMRVNLIYSDDKKKKSKDVMKLVNKL